MRNECFLLEKGTDPRGVRFAVRLAVVVRLDVRFAVERLVELERVPDPSLRSVRLT